MRSLTLTAALIVAAAHCAPTATTPAVDCTRELLKSVTDSYVAAQSAGAGLTGISSIAGSSVAYSENFKTVALGSSAAILSTALKIDHSRSSLDTTQCATYTELIVADPKHPYVLGTQMHVGADGKVSKIETLVTDKGDWLFNATGTLYWASREDWGTIPEAKRDSRAVIQAAADAYADIFNDKSVKVPWGSPCARLEGGSYTGRGAPTDKCDVGIPSGVKLTNRRYVIDETVGACDVMMTFASLPDSHEFRVEGGKLRFVHTLTVMGS